MICRALNYGRDNVKNILKRSMPFNVVLDMGVGKGNDLDIAHNVNSKATLYAVENYGPNIIMLRDKKYNVFSLNLEQEAIPLPDESVDVIIINQVLEHVKEIFWIFSEISRVLTLHGKVIIGVPI